MNRIDDLVTGLRQGMRKLASGVCIVSANDCNQGRMAMTASSVTSVSTSPASLLVCVHEAARIHHTLNETDYFCVNVLNQGQENVSNVCAGQLEGEERFSVGQWRQHENGIPYLADSSAVFVCKREKFIKHGTHGIYIANIEEVLIEEEPHPVLVYCDGAYHYL